jgi:CubicO group peptidase (beta-lactamase class C family)
MRYYSMSGTCAGRSAQRFQQMTTLKILTLSSTMALALLSLLVGPGFSEDVSPQLASLPQKFRVPGISAAFVKGGVVTAAGVAGVRQLGKRAAIQIDDRFHLGSCTKRMTSLMIYRLIDKHKLSLDSTLGQLLKGQPMREEYRTVTVRNLLQFKGGIQPYTLIDPAKTPAVFDRRGNAEEQRRRFVSHVLQEEPVAKPGTQAVYTNAGFAVLAYAASQATGKSWERLMTEEVFRPLGLKSAIFGRPQTPNAPSGHFRGPMGLQPEPAGYVHPASLSAAGDVSASMPDFAKYAAEELRIARGEGRVLTKATSLMMKEVSGFTEGRTVLGGAGAFTAGLTLWPSLNCAAVVAVNSGGGEQACQQVSQALKSSLVDGKPFKLSPVGYGFGLMLDPGGDVRVGSVTPGSVAAAAGLMEGDLVLEMNGVAMEDIPDEQRFAALKGKTLTLKVRRKGQVLEVQMVMAGD